MAKRLFLDFDGTLVDSRRRQHALFVELANTPALDFEEYWQAKRAGMRQCDMLAKYARFSTGQMVAFNEAWMAEIEAPQRLGLDTMIPGAMAFLDAVARGFTLYLLTGRQHRDRLIMQMEQLNIYGYFFGILNTAQRVSKSDHLRSHANFDMGDAVIGDSGEDILCGKTLGLRTIGVSSGASSVEQLQKYAPDVIVVSVAALTPSVLEGGLR